MLRLNRFWLAAPVTLALLLGIGPLQTAQPAKKVKERLVDQVRKAIDRGILFLRDKQRGDGSWELDSFVAQQQPGGCTALTLLALLNSGVSPDDPAVRKGLDFLRANPQAKTYVVGLETMVFTLAGKAIDRDRIQKNVDWLQSAQTPRGWGYNDVKIESADNSNSQYALLGLHEAILSGAKVDRKALEEMRDFYLASQNIDGGWGYSTKMPASSMTMSTACLCNLIITGLDVDIGKAKLDETTGVAANCGLYEENPKIAKALKWLGDRMPDTLSEGLALRWGSPFYALYGIERAGRLTGQRFLGGHDWYRVGCDYIVKAQNEDGSWGKSRLAEHRLDDWPVVATSFSLLFLSKGRTPVLLTKMAHGPDKGEDWNRKHSDMKNLVDFSSRELFKKKPMAWQIFDVRDKEANTEESRRDLAADLLSSPVVFLSGHTFLASDKELDVLKEYLENGGFVFAEACCGSKEFDRGFRAAMTKLFPDNDDPLQPLPGEHPVYTASGKFGVSAKEFPLYGVQKGCKTVLIYTDKPVAGFWEENLFDKGRGQKAFQLGANVIAYATGLEPPKERLTEVEIVADDKTGLKGRRNFLRIAQLRHEGDWQPAPKAMRNLMAEARKVGLDVVLKTEEVAVTSSAITGTDLHFFYMHGRNNFTFTAKELEKLKFNLENGGLLLADSCCGAKAFDESFRKMMDTMWGDKKLRLEPIPLNDDLYSAGLNGTAIEKIKCRRDADKRDREFKEFAPALEGIKVGKRWVVIYRKYDLGCALEKHASSDCLGHDYESAVRLGRAAVLYSLTR